MSKAPNALDESKDRLVDVLITLELELKKQNSLKFALLRGAVYGVGVVLGSTILITLLAGLAALIVGELGDLPVIEILFSEPHFDKYLEDAS